jgi:hypothetical protein
VLPAVPVARAQTWPSRLVRIVVGFLLTLLTSWRALMGDWLTQRLGQHYRREWVYASGNTE